MDASRGRSIFNYLTPVGVYFLGLTLRSNGMLNLINTTVPSILAGIIYLTGERGLSMTPCQRNIQIFLAAGAAIDLAKQDICSDGYYALDTFDRSMAYCDSSRGVWITHFVRARETLYLKQGNVVQLIRSGQFLCSDRDDFRSFDHRMVERVNIECNATNYHQTSI